MSPVSSKEEEEEEGEEEDIVTDTQTQICKVRLLGQVNFSMKEMSHGIFDYI